MTGRERIAMYVAIASAMLFSWAVVNTVGDFWGTQNSWVGLLVFSAMIAFGVGAIEILGRVL